MKLTATIEGQRLDRACVLGLTKTPDGDGDGPFVEVYVGHVERGASAMVAVRLADLADAVKALNVGEPAFRDGKPVLDVPTFGEPIDPPGGLLDDSGRVAPPRDASKPEASLSQRERERLDSVRAERVDTSDLPSPMKAQR